MYAPEELADILGQHRPTEQQSTVISSPMQPALVVAGAGSGKTATMADRVVWLLANGLARPENVLGVTFTRKAAGELQARIGAHITALRERGLLNTVDSDTPLDPEISTYHSYANRIVSDYGIRLGIEPDAAMLGAAQSYQVVSRLVDEYQGEWQHLTLARSSLIGAVLAFSSECAEHLVVPEDAERYLAEEYARLSVLPQEEGKNKTPTGVSSGLLERLHIRITVAQLAQAFARRKREMGVLDYGDLVRYAAKLADTVPQVRQQERARFTVVLLDEFQDTSHAQLTLFSRLFSDAHHRGAEASEARAVMAVGDPNQSIYGFRGASAGQLFSFAQAFPVVTETGKESAPSYFLSTAWRNSVNILRAANAVSASLRLGGDINQSSAQAIPELQPRPGAPAGLVEAEFFVTQEEEAAALASHISVTRSGTSNGVDGMPHQSTDVPTTAILCRQRSQFAVLAPALEERGISYEIVGLGGLIGQPEIVDLLATMHLLIDPSRSDALMRLITGARWRIGPADLMALSDWAQELSKDSEVGVEDAIGVLRHEHTIVDAIAQLPVNGWVSRHGRSLSGAARARLARLNQELSWLRTRLSENLLQLVSDIERTMLLDIEVSAKPGALVGNARLHLDAFYEEIANFMRGSERVDLAALLAWLEDVREQEQGLAMVQEELDPSAVQIMTVHASKGLEWDAVYVPGLVEGSFPTAKSARWSQDHGALPWPLRGDRHDLPVWDTDQPDLKSLVQAEKQLVEDAKEYSHAEERRLAYVAFTRARTYLWLSGARTKLTAVKPVDPSDYLVDVVDALGLEEARASIDLAMKIGEQDREVPQPTRVGWPYDPLEGPINLDTGLGIHPLAGRREPLETLARRVCDRVADPQWEEAQKDSEWMREAHKLLALRSVQSQGITAAEPDHLRASEVVAKAEDPEAWLEQQRRRVPIRPSREAKAGTAFHTWVETYYQNAGALDLDDFMESADAAYGASVELRTLQDTFKASEWAAKQPVHVEYPIETTINNRVIRGRIDAVFQDANGNWELVDWKSGRVPEAKDLKTKSIQLALYRIAWAKLHGINPEDVSIAFYYVGSGHTVRPDDLLSEAELEELVGLR